jgi:trehalose 6-phosphate phosphatase
MMTDILTQSNLEVVARFARSNVLLALDYDGTLAPIVDEPKEARMRPDTQELLERAARLYPCVVISGRAQSDVLKRVRGIKVSEVIGNHGLEPWRRNEQFAQRVQSWLPALQSELGSIEGVRIEDKVFSLAIHYRHSRDRALARDRILQAVAGLEGVRVMGGKEAVHLLPQGAPHKGHALEAARERWHRETAIYVGDDETDEDVFALDDPERLLAIRVGESPSSRAAFFLREQEDIDALLDLLIKLRTPPSLSRAESDEAPAFGEAGDPQREPGNSSRSERWR